MSGHRAPQRQTAAGQTRSAQMQKEAGPKDADRPWRASPEPVKGRQQASRRKEGQRISHKKSERAKLVPTCQEAAKQMPPQNSDVGLN